MHRLLILLALLFVAPMPAGAEEAAPALYLLLSLIHI